MIDMPYLLLIAVYRLRVFVLKTKVHILSILSFASLNIPDIIRYNNSIKLFIGLL